MRDRAFSGGSVEEALNAASRELGLAPEALRYVVLETGAPAGRGLGATPARIVVLLDSPAPRPAPSREDQPEPMPPGEGTDPQRELAAVVRKMLDAAGLDLELQVESEEDTIRVRLLGPDRDFFYGEEGEVLPAAEHLLQRMFGRVLAGYRIRLECEGYRERRDQEVRARALALAAAVKETGVARTTEPLNAYERRLVHLAVGEVEELVTFSVGEGDDRRVTVALRSAGPAAGGDGT